MKNILEINYANISSNILQRYRPLMRQAAPDMLVKFYWDLGVQLNQISKTFKPRAYKEFLDALSLDLRRAQPEVYAFSLGSLDYMCRFAKEYPQMDFKQPLAQLPWGNLTQLMTMVRDRTLREKLAGESVSNQWSLYEQEVQIEKMSGREKQCKYSPYVRNLAHDRNIPEETTYKDDAWFFPRTYNWKSIHFVTETNGHAHLSIRMRHHLSLPELTNLLAPKGQHQLPGVTTYHDRAKLLNTFQGLHNIITLHFHLNQNGCDVIDTPETILRMLCDFLRRLRTQIPPNVQRDDFNKMKAGLMKAYKEYLEDCQNGFPGLTAFERTVVPPKQTETEFPDRVHIDEMWRAIGAKDEKALQELYAKGMITPEFKDECLIMKAIDENNHEEIRVYLEKQLITKNHYLYGLSLLSTTLHRNLKTPEDRFARLKTIELLLYFRASLLHATPDNDETLLERVLHVCDYSETNPLVLEYCKDIIKRIIPNENNVSNVIVCKEMREDPIGKVVFDLNKKWNENKREPNITKVIIDSSIKFITKDSELAVEPISVNLLSQYEVEELFKLFERRFPGKDRSYFNEEIMAETDSAVWVDRIYLRTQLAPKKLVGFTVSTNKKITSMGKDFLLYHARLAVQDGIPNEVYGTITSLILLQRGFVLQERHPDSKVLTVYDAATLQGFLTSEGLEFYPKDLLFDNILLEDTTKAIYPNHRFQDRKNNRFYVEDTLADVPKPGNNKKEPGDGVTYRDIAKKDYSDRFFLRRASLIMIFENNKKNLLGLSQHHNQNFVTTSVQDLIKQIAEFQEKVESQVKFTAKL